MENQSAPFSKYLTILAITLIGAGLYRLTSFNNPLAHTLLETFGIIIASGVFMLAWNSRRFQDNNYFLFLGIAYFFVGALELLHLLASPGIDVFSLHSSNLAVQLRIITRYIESTSLLMAPFFIHRKLKPHYLFLSYVTVTSLFVWAIAGGNILPGYSLETIGSARLVIVNESVICFILLAAIVIMLQKRQGFDPAVLHLLTASIILTIASELAFITIQSPDEYLNLIGHVLKVASFYLIYKAVIEIGLMKPYHLLFRNLSRSEEELRKHRFHLEELVQERTQELAVTSNDLERSTYWNNLILEAVGEGIYGVDVQGNTTFVNQAALVMTGFKAEEFIGRHQHEILHHSRVDGSPYPAEECPIYASIKDGLSHQMSGEIFWRKDGASFPVEYLSTPIKEKGRIIGAVVVFRDISDLKKVENEKAQIQAQLLQSQKMEAIGILAGGVAHDFNNLLSIISGHVTLALMKMNKTDPVFRNLEQIHLTAHRAANVTRQLLLFSRKQPMEPTSLNLNEVIDNLLKMLHRLIGEDMAIALDQESNLWPVLADEGTLEQVIMNLTVNARDAMPKGGTLTIRTENITLSEESLRNIPEAREGQFVRLSIEDTGTGMDKETMSRIFEPFFTTKGLGKGTGLGLAVVYGIVKQNEGWINVYSEPQQGSVFKIYLPASSIRVEDKRDEAVSSKGFQGKGERILVVEDEEDVRRMTVEALQENGYSVTEAANAQEALTIFQQEKGRINLVLSDVVLPDQPGTELVDQLHLLKPQLQILLMSGYTDQKLQWPLIKKRGFRFLQKPFILPDLLKILREMLEPLPA
ncbi:MAG: MASE3 domain-containing protein [bacterium]